MRLAMEAMKYQCLSCCFTTNGCSLCFTYSHIILRVYNTKEVGGADTLIKAHYRKKMSGLSVEECTPLQLLLKVS